MWNKKKRIIFLVDKIKRLEFYDKNRVVLYGYKLYFKGRFIRK